MNRIIVQLTLQLKINDTNLLLVWQYKSSGNKNFEFTRDSYSVPKLF